MLTEQYIHTLNNVLVEQGVGLLNTQNQIATAYYVNRTGELLSSLGQGPVANNMHLSLSYPKYIRMLDLKRGRGGKTKGNYEPIYNKYTYGFLYIGLYRRLSGALSGLVRMNIVSQFNK